MNRARPSKEKHIKNHLVEIPRSISHKRYTTIAQAVFICERKNEVFQVQEELDIVRDKRQTQLHKNGVTGLPELPELPELFSDLQHYHSHTEQAKAATKILSYLKDEGIITEIGGSNDERLQLCAQVCARLCYSSGFELPRNLSDAMLPDLVVKLANMMFGRDSQWPKIRVCF